MVATLGRALCSVEGGFRQGASRNYYALFGWWPPLLVYVGIGTRQIRLMAAIQDQVDQEVQWRWGLTHVSAFAQSPTGWINLLVPIIVWTIILTANSSSLQTVRGNLFAWSQTSNLIRDWHVESHQVGPNYGDGAKVKKAYSDVMFGTPRFEFIPISHDYWW